MLLYFKKIKVNLNIKYIENINKSKQNSNYTIK